MPAKKSSSAIAPTHKESRPKWVLWVSIGLVVLLVVVLAAILKPFQGLAPAAGSTPTIALPAAISVDDADYLYQNNAAFFLDVRSVADWTSYRIDTSKNIPLGQLSGRLNELPKAAVIIVVDEYGETGSQARDMLKKAGFPTVTSMTGGMEAWVQKGYPFLGTAPY